MAITIDDFSKIWASTSPLTPYEFSENNYKEGWDFVGATPPSRQMWDFLQKNNDEKSQYLLNNFDNYLPLSGGTVTGDLSVGGTITGNLTGDVTGTASKATADENGNNIASTYASIQYVDDKIAPIGTMVEASSPSSVSVSTNTATEVTHISLTAGTWIITGHINYAYASIQASKVYGIGINDSITFYYGLDGAMGIQSSVASQGVALHTSVIMKLTETKNIYLIAYANANCSAEANCPLKAVRII